MMYFLFSISFCFRFVTFRYFHSPAVCVFFKFVGCDNSWKIVCKIRVVLVQCCLFGFDFTAGIGYFTLCWKHCDKILGLRRCLWRGHVSLIRHGLQKCVKYGSRT